MTRRYSIAAVISALGTLLGVLITLDLSDIPFGLTFSIALNTALVLLVLTLVLISLLIAKSRRPWVRWAATLPLVTSGIVFIAAIAVQNDPRLIHYRGLPPVLSPREWQEDAQFLVDAIARNHPGLYALVDSSEWKSVTDSIVTRIPALSEQDILMGLFRITSIPQDGHTFPFIMAPCFDLHSFPLVLYGFPEGWYVVRTGRELSELVGHEIIAIEGKSINHIYNSYSQLLAWENEQSRRERFTFVVVMAEWLASHKIISNTDVARFTFRTAAGDTVNRTLSPVPLWQHFQWSGATPISNEESPVFAAPRENAYSFRLMDDQTTLYIQFNQCIDQPGRKSAREFALDVERFVSERPARRCILDLRNNDGGGRVYTELLRVLRAHPGLNRRGHLFVLIGRRTFSAAVMFATELQLQTEALFVGEPTGQGTVFYSRPRIIALPHSGLLFAVSSSHTVAGFAFDSRKAIRPDIPIAYGIDDFRSRHDPVLRTALQYEEPTSEVHQAPDRNKIIVGRYQKDETMILDITERDGVLSCRITDALPNTPALFMSRLKESFDGGYTTRLPGVSLQFGSWRSGNPMEVTLAWMGSFLTFKRTDGVYEIPFERFAAGNVTGGCEMIRRDAERCRRIYPDLEALLNRIGYEYLRGSNTSAALQVFLLNVELYPLSSNVYDSYGEALMVDGQIDSSIASYARSLALNPNNSNAERVLERLRKLQ